ncbi:MAG: hypothetical protein PHE67_00600 [Campylobacterales bacterium]|nr:hypothetical protein [Campylobacterales bacterium]
MKYLRHYVEDSHTSALNKHGAFFAFSNKQFLEAKKEGVEYISLGAGLICPKENAKALMQDISSATDMGIKQDIEENGLEAIIKRELSNYECYYSNDIDDAVRALKSYNISREQIQAVFNGERIKQDF